MYAVPLGPQEYRSLQDRRSKLRALSSPTATGKIAMKLLSNYQKATDTGKPREVGATDQYLGVAAKSLRRIKLGPALRKSSPQRPSIFT